MHKFIDDIKFFSILFEAIPAVTLIINEQARISAINSAARDIFNITEKEAFLKKSGKVLHCINAIENSEACGTTAACKECIVRNTAMQAIEGNHIKRAKGKLIIQDKELHELYVLVSASPLEYKGEKFAIVILEDISNIVELQGLLPICSHCNNIYNKDGYWERLEKYIEDHSEAEFTHGICPECMQKMYPNIKMNS